MRCAAILCTLWTAWNELPTTLRHRMTFLLHKFQIASVPKLSSQVETKYLLSTRHSVLLTWWRLYRLYSDDLYQEGVPIARPSSANCHDSSILRPQHRVLTQQVVAFEVCMELITSMILFARSRDSFIIVSARVHVFDLPGWAEERSVINGDRHFRIWNLPNPGNFVPESGHRFIGLLAFTRCCVITNKYCSTRGLEAIYHAHFSAFTDSIGHFVRN